MDPNRKQILTIHIKLNEYFLNANLSLLHTLVDTLEERGIGEVFDEGMGEDFMDVALDIIPSEEKVKEIKSILQSLGILEASKLTYEELEEE
jgi:hypothetical protein